MSVNVSLQGGSDDRRPDVWMVNRSERLVQVTAAHAQIMVRVGKGRAATLREIELYQKRLADRGVSKARPKPGSMTEAVAEARATADLADLNDAPSDDPSAISRAEATTALKPYDTKAKLLALAAKHEIEGLTDKLTVADIKDALAAAIVEGRIQYDAV